MISVVIPAHNASETLDKCLQEIARSEWKDYEVIVVDDASTDGTAQAAVEYSCRLICLPENVGAAEAKNIGARAARGDIILFIDSDIIIQPQTLGQVATAMNDQIDAVVGLLGPKLRYANFASQFKNLWMYYTYRRLAASQRSSQGVGVFYTSLAAIRRDGFLRLGGFDTNYRGASVTEDIEFGQRLLSSGQRVRVDPQLVVEHLKHYTLGGLLKTDVSRARGLTKTFLRKKLERQQREAGQKYYASVPWFFILGVPLAWLLPVFVLAGALTRQPGWLVAALLSYLGMLLLNAPFLDTLRRVRGIWFFIQSCLFLPIDLWVSGLGVLLAIMSYLNGERY